VSGESFADLVDAETLALQCPPEQKALLLDMSPDIYFETEQYVGLGAVLVRLGRISDEELAIRLENSWRHKAPKDLSDALPLAGQPRS
jgi:hypothetical protein